MKKLSLLLCLVLLCALLTACFPDEDFSSVTGETTTTTGTETTLSNESPADSDTQSESTTTPTVTTLPESSVSTDETTLASETSQSTSVTADGTTGTTTNLTTTSSEQTTGTEIPVSGGSVQYNPLNFSEQRAMWFTYLDYTSILLGKTKAQFTTEITKRFKNAKGFGINTVYIHARAHGDAYYDSDIFPWAWRCAGSIGVSPGFDPLQIIVDTAHSLGLSVHAWINPLRCMTDAEMKQLSSDYILKQWYLNSSLNGNYIVNVSGVWYLNPAYSDVRKLISDGVSEIVSNYKVDGIHIDDYFYPTTDTSFDSSAYASSGADNLSQWRIANVNKLVKNMYNAVKGSNSKVLFGISPQGFIANNYDELYADVRTWASQNGYCDYIVPQVYYGFKNQAATFTEIVTQWEALTASSNVKLIIGIGTYKIGLEDKWAGTGKYEWINDSEVASKQLAYALNQEESDGIAVYSYASTFEPASAVAEMVNAEAERMNDILNSQK